MTNLSSKEDNSYKLDKEAHVHKLVSSKDLTHEQWIVKRLIFRNNEILEYKYSFGSKTLKGFEHIDLEAGYLYNVTALAITYYCPICLDVTMENTIVNLKPVSVLVYVFGSLVPFVLIICAVAFGIFYYKRYFVLLSQLFNLIYNIISELKIINIPDNFQSVSYITN